MSAWDIVLAVLGVISAAVLLALLGYNLSDLLWRRPKAPPPKPSILGDGRVLAEAYAERENPYAKSPLLEFVGPDRVRLVRPTQLALEANRRKGLHRCGLQCVAFGCVYGKLPPPVVVKPQRLGGWTAQVAKAGWPAHNWVPVGTKWRMDGDTTVRVTYRCARCLAFVVAGPVDEERWRDGDIGNCHVPMVPGEWAVDGKVVAVRLVDLKDRTFQDSQGLVYPLGEGRVPG